MVKKSGNPNIVFRRTWKIGAPDAESDQRLLDSCFVDIGALEELTDCEEPRRIVVGRTGIGKTALLKQLEKVEENVVVLDPEVLSLNHIANSNVIKFLEEIEVHLDLFYKILWNHVLAVELIRKKFNISNESSRKNFFENILPNVSRKSIARERAVKYLEEWGDKFWTETEYRIKEFTNKLENDVKASLGAKYQDVGFGVEAARNLSSEQKGEIIRRTREVVEKGQISELFHVISLLDEDIFVDQQQKYFIVIYKLDEDWVDDSIKYKLIKALIEVIRSFQKIRNVKIVAAIRTDLLQRVLRNTAYSGFQDEKYEALYLKLRWSQDELETVLDRRISEVFKSKYTKGEIHFRDVFPKNQMEKTDAFGYILKRTSLRPREVIMFVNECIERADGKTRITADIIRSAEVTYSQKRVISLQQEWGSDYVNISKYINIIKTRKPHFPYSEVECEEITSSVGDCLQQQEMFDDRLARLGRLYINGECSEEEIKREWFSIMYRIGVLGMKPSANIQVQWSFLDEPEILDGQELDDAEFYVHPAYWIALGVAPR